MGRIPEFWTGGITNPLTVIEQISFLMFARLLDMRESTEEKRWNRTKQRWFNPLRPAASPAPSAAWKRLCSSVPSVVRSLPHGRNGVGSRSRWSSRFIVSVAKATRTGTLKRELQHTAWGVVFAQRLRIRVWVSYNHGKYKRFMPPNQPLGQDSCGRIISDTQKGALPMPGMQTKSIKSAARELVDSLPDDVTWDDVMYRVYVRQAIDAGRQDAAEGRLVDVAEVRRQFGLPE